MRMSEFISLFAWAWRAGLGRYFTGTPTEFVGKIDGPLRRLRASSGEVPKAGWMKPSLDSVMLNSESTAYGPASAASSPPEEFWSIHA